MLILIGAVLTASVLGSMHCVGMCGPLAIWASGAGDANSRLAFNASLYHAGRLLTYALVGLLAGMAGQLTDLGGEVLGIQLAAARIVGAIMVVIGTLQVIKWLSLRSGSFGWMTPKNASPNQSIISKWLVSLRPRVFSLNPASRALATGLLTALLPCGWLYLFALFAAGTGNWWTGSLVMTAFWLGSVPALVAVVVSTKLFAGRVRQYVPAAVALMLIVAGGFTMAGRGFANLHSLSEISARISHDASRLFSTTPTRESVTHSLEELVKTPLPCCQKKE